ncbi:MAG: hypothetical protein WBJ81_01865 [Rickettsiales bacterium]
MSIKKAIIQVNNLKAEELPVLPGIVGHSAIYVTKLYNVYGAFCRS